MSDMRIVISGSSGLLGTALVATLRSDGHQMLRLVRGEARGPDQVSWDPVSGTLDPTVLREADAVVNLSGAPVGAHRWTPAHKQLIRSSRVDSTSTLAHALATAETRPRLMLSASAIGFYGDTGEAAVDEKSPGGTG